MAEKKILGLSARLLLFIVPVIIGSLLLSGTLSGYYTDRGVRKALNQLLVYKAEDLIRHASFQWDLLLENNLEGDSAYQESLRRSVRSYSITMLREDGEWILAVDEDMNILFSVGVTPTEEVILKYLPDYQLNGSSDIWIDGIFGGEKRVGYGFDIPSLGWVVYITDLQSSYFGNLSRVRINFAVMIVFTAIVTSLFIILFVRRSMWPLRTVIHDMQAIVLKRDFERRVTPVQNDEVGQLAKEFNLMSDYLGRAMNRLKNIAHSEAEARIEIRNRERETLDVLSRTSDYKDPETAKHTTRVGMYAALLSELRGDSREEIDLMRWAVPLHDIGKLGIPDAILLKNEALTNEERIIIESHVLIGHEILKDSASPILRAGADIVRSHHERWDGSGYPEGLKGTEIPVRGRITGMVDVFDALTTARTYKKAWTFEDSIQWIQGKRGVDFDPELVDLFTAASDRVRSIFIDYGDADDDMEIIKTARS